MLIPLEAIREVRGRGRDLELELTSATRSDSPAPVYVLHDASAAAVTAFCAAVRARLPERAPGAPAVDGDDLITVVSVRRSRRPSVRALLIASVSTAFVAIDVTIVVLGGSSWILVLPVFQLYVVVGVLMGLILGRGLYDGWRLQRHGITVVAELDRYTDRKAVYRYVDHHGEPHHHMLTYAGQEAELSYDPLDPGRATARMPFHERFGMAFMAVVGLSLACAGLWLTGHELVVALRG